MSYRAELRRMPRRVRKQILDDGTVKVTLREQAKPKGSLTSQTKNRRLKP